MITIASTVRQRQDVIQVLEQLSGHDFRFFGMGHLAYIRPVRVDGQNRYAICGADGTPLSVVDTAQEAREIIMRNDMGAGTAMLH